MTLNTKSFMKEIKARNALFDNDEHHDSHEFLMWFINQVNDEYISEIKYQRRIEQDSILEVDTKISDIF